MPQIGIGFKGFCRQRYPSRRIQVIGIDFEHDIMGLHGAQAMVQRHWQAKIELALNFRNPKPLDLTKRRNHRLKVIAEIALNHADRPVERPRLVAEHSP